jgi:two-component system response regulator CpxR
MLTARGDDIDRIVGLEIGADDYLPKPCNPRELVARLRAILRRTHKTPQHKPILSHQDILLDCSKRTASLHEEVLDLTNAEFNILEMLMKSPGQAYSKEELTEYALGRKFTAYDRSIDVHISNLRNKLGDPTLGEAIIKTVRGFGYMLHA